MKQDSAETIEEDSQEKSQTAGTSAPTFADTPDSYFEHTGLTQTMHGTGIEEEPRAEKVSYTPCEVFEDTPEDFLDGALGAPIFAGPRFGPEEVLAARAARGFPDLVDLTVQAPSASPSGAIMAKVPASGWSGASSEGKPELLSSPQVPSASPSGAITAKAPGDKLEHAQVLSAMAVSAVEQDSLEIYRAYQARIPANAAQTRRAVVAPTPDNSKRRRQFNGLAAPPTTPLSTAPVEKTWEEKQRHREIGVAAVKRSPEYHEAQLRRTSGKIPEDLPATPDATDPAIPKRTWEKAVQVWREGLRHSAGES